MRDKYASDAPDEAAGSLSKDAINALPLYFYAGEIHLIRTAADVESAVARLFDEPVLGFDTETRPSFVRGRGHPPSLIQLAGEHEVCLFQLQWQPLLPPLAGLLASDRVLKTGVAIHDDMHALEKLYPFAPAGVVDLAALARRHNLHHQGLRALAAHFLGVRISKGEQCTNWEVRELSSRQIRYAATDAWVSRAIYLKMREQGLTDTFAGHSFHSKKYAL